VCHTERDELVRRLDERVVQMWADGLVDEVAGLIPRGLDEGVTARRAIGYAQALGQIRSELTQDQAIAETQALTRRYARRQVSWFKRYDSSTLVDVSAADSESQISNLVHRVVADLAP
jgi:tRNA dimethylallyltransferase